MKVFTAVQILIEIEDNWNDWGAPAKSNNKAIEKEFAQLNVGTSKSSPTQPPKPVANDGWDNWEEEEKESQSSSKPASKTAEGWEDDKDW